MDLEQWEVQKLKFKDKLTEICINKIKDDELSLEDMVGVLEKIKFILLVNEQLKE
jgi:hypothetical protein